MYKRGFAQIIAVIAVAVVAAGGGTYLIMENKAETGSAVTYSKEIPTPTLQKATHFQSPKQEKSTYTTKEIDSNSEKTTKKVKEPTINEQNTETSNQEKEKQTPKTYTLPNGAIIDENGNILNKDELELIKQQQRAETEKRIAELNKQKQEEDAKRDAEQNAQQIAAIESQMENTRVRYNIKINEIEQKILLTENLYDRAEEIYRIYSNKSSWYPDFIDIQTYEKEILDEFVTYIEDPTAHRRIYGFSDGLVVTNEFFSNKLKQLNAEKAALYNEFNGKILEYERELLSLE